MDSSKQFNIDVAARFAKWFRSGFSIPQPLRIANHEVKNRHASEAARNVMHSTESIRKVA